MDVCCEEDPGFVRVARAVPLARRPGHVQEVQKAKWTSSLLAQTRRQVEQHRQLSCRAAGHELIAEAEDLGQARTQHLFHDTQRLGGLSRRFGRSCVCEAVCHALWPGPFPGSWRENVCALYASMNKLCVDGHHTKLCCCRVAVRGQKRHGVAVAFLRWASTVCRLVATRLEHGQRLPRPERK